MQSDMEVNCNRQNCTYILGEKTTIAVNEYTEIWPSLSPSSIKLSSLQKVTCGLLNSHHRSVIYFGLSESGIVTGMPLNRQERDELRLMWDNIVANRISPQLIHSNVKMVFVPVVEKGLNSCVRLGSSYIVEIHLNPLKSVLYTTGSKCYLREHVTTRELNSKEIRNLAVCKEMKVYSNVIQSLYADIKSLRNVTT